MVAGQPDKVSYHQVALICQEVRATFIVTSNDSFSDGSHPSCTVVSICVGVNPFFVAFNTANIFSFHTETCASVL